MGDPVTYRFAPRDSSGWLLGLSGGQCLSLSTAGLAASASLWAELPDWVGLVLATAGVLAAFAQISGVSAWDAVSAFATMTVDRRVASTGTGARLLTHGVGAVDVPVSWAQTPVGVIRSERAASASLRVQGRSFALADHGEQDRLLAAWGAALGSFCLDRSPVTRLVLTSWSGPMAPEAVLCEGPTTYRALVREAATSFTTVDAILTIVIDDRRVRGTHPDRVERAVVEELRLLVGRLELAGLNVDPLDSTVLNAIVARQLQPAGPTRPSARTLAHVDDLSGDTPRPGWASAQLGEVHRAWEVIEWPRGGVHAPWMEPLLLGAAGPRTISVSFTPTSAKESRRRLDREAVRLATDQEQRRRAGFRSNHRGLRASELLDARAAELVDGHGEVSFAGILAVTAPTSELLAERSAELEAAAGRCGLELRPLNGRHHRAVAACLPLPTDIAAEGWWA